MGGNAIKDVVRLEKEQYQKVVDEVLDTLKEWYPDNRAEEIKYYANKSSFGDLDVIIEEFEHEVGESLFNLVVAKYSLVPGDWYANGSVLSFRYPLGEESFQVDIVRENYKTFEMAKSYFAYNDLGNLIGRMSKKLGFKIGHSGLSFIVRDGDYKVKDIFFDHNWESALTLLELSVERYNEGFDNMDDIFEFVASSPYFNPEIFLLHNRNHRARVRDQKRKTYNSFLVWCEENEDTLTHYPYQSERDHYGYGSPSNMNIKFLENVLFKKYPELKIEIDETLNYVQLVQQVKKIYDGKLVMMLTGLSGKELGHHMRKIESSFETKVDMLNWMLNASEEEIHNLVRSHL